MRPEELLGVAAHDILDGFDEAARVLEYVGVGVTWAPCENFSLSASVTQTWNSSTDADSQYSAFDAGGMLGLQFRL